MPPCANHMLSSTPCRETANAIRSTETARVHLAYRGGSGFNCMAALHPGAATRANTADRCADGLRGERSGCAVLPLGIPGMRSRSWGGPMAAIFGSNFAGAPLILIG